MNSEWIEYEGLPPVDGKYIVRMDECDDWPMIVTVADGVAYKKNGERRIFMNFQWQEFSA